MEKYTIYCTEEQTGKALELGAPIEFEAECPVDLETLERSPYPDIKMGKDGEPILIIPTAEQMKGWLRSQGFRFRINEYESCSSWRIKDGWQYQGFCDTPKEATLAAIDAALDYLIKNKK